MQEKENILEFLDSLKNNTFYESSISSLKTNFEEKLKAIFDEIKKNDNLTSQIPAENRAILFNDKFNLNNLSTFSIFNDIVLRNLNIINLFLVQPAYSKIHESLIRNMGDILNNYSLLFIGFFTLFIASVLMFFFFDWRPLQNNLDSTVFLFLFFNFFH